MDPSGRRPPVGGRFVPRVEALPQAVAERAVELAVSALDLNALLDRVDLNALLDRVDLNRCSHGWMWKPWSTGWT